MIILIIHIQLFVRERLSLYWSCRLQIDYIWMSDSNYILFYYNENTSLQYIHVNFLNRFWAIFHLFLKRVHALTDVSDIYPLIEISQIDDRFYCIQLFVNSRSFIGQMFNTFLSKIINRTFVLHTNHM